MNAHDVGAGGEMTNFHGATGGATDKFAVKGLEAETGTRFIS